MYSCIPYTTITIYKGTDIFWSGRWGNYNNTIKSIMASKHILILIFEYLIAMINLKTGMGVVEFVYDMTNSLKYVDSCLIYRNTRYEITDKLFSSNKQIIYTNNSEIHINPTYTITNNDKIIYYTCSEKYICQQLSFDMIMRKIKYDDNINNIMVL